MKRIELIIQIIIIGIVVILLVPPILALYKKAINAPANIEQPAVRGQIDYVETTPELPKRTKIVGRPWREPTDDEYVKMHFMVVVDTQTMNEYLIAHTYKGGLAIIKLEKVDQNVK